MRRRQWLVAALVMALCWGAVAGWGFFVWYRAGEHQEPLPPGQAYTQADGSSLRITTWRVLKSIDDSQGEPVPAPKDASWVQVLVDSRDVGPDTSCAFSLAGPDQVRWEQPVQAPYRGERAYCSDNDGPNDTLEVLFLVPDRALPTVRGLALDHPMSVRQPPILTPPA